jgi:hypothetical protein
MKWNMHYLRYYDLEKYLFNDVRLRFEREARIDHVDFYLILIWKANRAKNITRDRLAREAGSFPEAIERIAVALSVAKENQAKLKVLMDKPWNFRLPTASAILTVLYPEEFTVYDERVCEALPSFKKLGDRRCDDAMWNEYLEFKHAVESCTPPDLCLRDKDRYLFGKSFYEQARKDAGAQTAN